jgi:hypothetical protein
VNETISEIKLKMPLRRISQKLIDDLQNLPESQDGMAVMRILVYDEEKKFYVNMMSRKFRIGLTPELEQLLEEHPYIRMNVN